MPGPHPDQLNQNLWGLDPRVLKLLGDPNTQRRLRAVIFRLYLQEVATDLRNHESRIHSRCEARLQAWLSSYAQYNLREVNLASSLK